MLALLIAAAAAASAAPIVATVLVSTASRSEDRAWSLADEPRGPVRAIARKIVDFHSEGPFPQPKSRVPARSPVAAAARPARSPAAAATRPARRPAHGPAPRRTGARAAWGARVTEALR